MASLRKRLVETLYVETMLLADDARFYFDEIGRHEREWMSAEDRMLFTTESLRATTRLMHIIAWLLTRRAVEAEEIGEDEARGEDRRLGATPRLDPDAISTLPDAARVIITATHDLHGRAVRLQQAIEASAPPTNPARDMMESLRRRM